MQRRLAGQNIDRARQLGEPDFKLVRLPLKSIVEFFPLVCEQLTEGTMQVSEFDIEVAAQPSVPAGPVLRLRLRL
jgi:hypothetical protein